MQPIIQDRKPGEDVLSHTLRTLGRILGRGALIVAALVTVGVAGLYISNQTSSADLPEDEYATTTTEVGAMPADSMGVIAPVDADAMGETAVSSEVSIPPSPEATADLRPASYPTGWRRVFATGDTTAFLKHETGSSGWVAWEMRRPRDNHLSVLEHTTAYCDSGRLLVDAVIAYPLNNREGSAQRIRTYRYEPVAPDTYGEELYKALCRRLQAPTTFLVSPETARGGERETGPISSTTAVGEPASGEEAKSLDAPVAPQDGPGTAEMNGGQDSSVPLGTASRPA